MSFARVIGYLLIALSFPAIIFSGLFLWMARSLGGGEFLVGGLDNQTLTGNLIFGIILLLLGIFINKISVKYEMRNMENEAKNREEDLDYSGALNIWETLGNREEAKRIRKKIGEEKKIRVDQKVVHGDEVTNTEIKDSVVNKSNIGSGGEDKFTKLKELKEMLAEGLISDEEFEKMKKEIIG